MTRARRRGLVIVNNNESTMGVSRAGASRPRFSVIARSAKRDEAISAKGAPFVARLLRFARNGPNDQSLTRNGTDRRAHDAVSHFAIKANAVEIQEHSALMRSANAVSRAGGAGVHVAPLPLRPAQSRAPWPRHRPAAADPRFPRLRGDASPSGPAASANPSGSCATPRFRGRQHRCRGEFDR